MRRKLSEELGFLVQSVHIRDNFELKPNAYRISILGVPVGEGEIYSRPRSRDQSRRRRPRRSSGISTKDPAFGLDAYWIEPAGKEHAQALGFTVVDASTVVATHLSELLKRHALPAARPRGSAALLDRLAKSAPKLVENLTPGALTLGVVVKVMQELLVDRVPVRNIRTIAETLAEHGGRTQDPLRCSAHVREALGGSIVQGIYGLRNELPVITLDTSLEQMLRDGVQRRRRQPDVRARPRRPPARRVARGDAAAGAQRRARRAARADAVATVARAVHAPRRAESRGARLRRDSAQQIAAGRGQRRWPECCRPAPRPRAPTLPRS